ncbi:uncharacterized protein LOC111334103 [Rhizophagus irregularis DAOM 181602=DAOM 197198]|nr:uncharacterized protein LOC111334103 [Rhizophagus irregularis DAOM 181602=DAOM 197198]
MQIDPDPHYEVVFERRDQVRIGKELTDSNFTADIAIGTPGEHDYASFLTAHNSYLETLFGYGNFSEDDGVDKNHAESRRLCKLRIRLGILSCRKNIYRNLAIPTTHRSRTYTTPKRSCHEKGVVNPANDDDKCFQWAILAALHPNPTIALCICEWRDHRLCPIYVTDRDDAEGRKIIDLVLISNGEKQHYCWIKNMSRLVNKRTKDGHATFVCRWCISHFTHQQEIHDKHVAICRGLKKTPQADRMPSVKKGNDIYEFKNWKRRMQLKNCLKYANLKCEL